MEGAIAISGMGAATGYGAGMAPLWTGIERGADCLRPIERFPAAALTSPLADVLPPWSGALHAEQEERLRVLCIRAAVHAAREGGADAKAEGAGVRPDRVALVVGASTQAEGRGLEEQTRKMARA